jgi:retinol dehydrogenase-16
MFSFGICWIDVLLDILAVYAVVKLVSFLVSLIKSSNLNQKVVMITGCDSGFGMMTAIQLAKEYDMKVLAPCLTKEGIDRIQKESKNIVAFQMDVTKDSSVDEAFEKFIKPNCPNGLYCLLNNAGVLRAGTLDTSPISDWDLQLSVNVVGIARITKKCFHLLRKASGEARVINIASVAGRFATPSTSSYNASKYAVEGLSDSWRREFKAFGIKVSIIEPGVMKTPLWDESMNKQKVEQTWKSLSKELQDFYGKDYFVKGQKGGEDFVNKLGQEPQIVVDVLKHAVTALRPYTRYNVGHDAKFVFLPFSYLPTVVADYLWLNVIQKDIPTPAGLLKKVQ